MPVTSVGLYTARDDLAIQWTKDILHATLQDFIALPTEEAREKYRLGPDARDWQVALAQKDVKVSKLSEAKIQPINYRPFDIRFTYYTGTSRGLICMPRPEVMHNMIAGGNLAICFMRRSREQIVSNFFVANHIVDKTILSSADNANVAPLYIYPEPNKHSLFDTNESSTAPGGRRSNLSPTFITAMTSKLGIVFVPDGKGNLRETFGPEDVFDYLYAVFHSPTYRSRYAEFLKIDFPRLPLISDTELFRELCALGERLVKLHLMEQAGKSIPLPKYPVAGNNAVEKVEYLHTQTEPEAGRVSINKTQYFEGVPPSAWEFHVGGYQVCQKWLKDRKGRALSFDDIKQYQRIVAALAETIAVMEQIDEVIEEQGGWPIE